MKQLSKTYIYGDTVFSHLIMDNPSLISVLEFFNISDAINDYSVAYLCEKNNIHQDTLLIIANLYNGFVPTIKEIDFESLDCNTIIRFLKKAHLYYINEKYPEIKDYIKQLYAKQNVDEIKLIEQFFNSYFEEVLEHLNYEEEVAFPYFSQLLDNNKMVGNSFSVKEYSEHHTDIETKLVDLKNLLIKHIALKGDFSLKRRIIHSLSMLENDLYIHSMIEESVLLPLVEQLEKMKCNG